MSMEQIAGIIIFGVLGIPGIIFGMILFSGKGADLIAGYNSLSEKERKKWWDALNWSGLAQSLI